MPTKSPVKSFFVKFRIPILFAVFAILTHAFIAIPWIQSELIVPYTVSIAAVTRLVLGLFIDGVYGGGNVVADDYFSMTILNVCNGTDLWVLYSAAVLSFPASAKAKLVGIAVGLPVLAVLNLVRVVGLFITGRYAPDLMEFSHDYLWQAILVLVTALCFGAYLKFMALRSRT